MPAPRLGTVDRSMFSVTGETWVPLRFALVIACEKIVTPAPALKLEAALVKDPTAVPFTAAETLELGIFWFAPAVSAAAGLSK